MFKYLLCIFLFFSAVGNAQLKNKSKDNVWPHFDLSSMVIGSSNGETPFWMRTNNYGSIPLEGVSGTLLGTVRKEYNRDSLSWSDTKWDWAAGAELRMNTGTKIEAQLLAAYLKAKYSIFQIQAGRNKDMIGLIDSSLSSGSFAVSGNALGVPKLDISIPHYWTLPILKGVIAIKGNFNFGFAGNMNLRRVIDSNIKDVTTFYHQKSFYGRIGKDSWKLKVYGGFNHQVFFGNESRIFGSDFKLNFLQDLWYVTSGKAYANKSVVSSKVGNHLGSLDQAVSYDFKSIYLYAYHQFFYDVGGLAHLNNIKDGLWGLTIANKKTPKTTFYWHKILFEFLNSKSQGGELTEKITPSGDEDYYNNYIYYDGWSYKGENIGNNFFTNKKYIKKNLPSFNEYIGNNRLLLFHGGIEWGIKDWTFVNKFSFSRNYGTYATSPIGNTTGRIRIVQPPPYFYPVDQFSAYLEASRPLKNNFRIGFVLAGDYGELLYNSIGGMVKLTKSW